MTRLLCIVALLFATPAFAAKVQEVKTPAGFTAWLVEEHSLPLLNINVSFKDAGVAYDPAGKEGRTNLVAALLMEGAGDLDAKTFNERLEDYAIRLNIAADDDFLHASMATLSEHRDVAFSMLGDALSHPRFDEDAVARARAKMQVLLVEQSQSPYFKLTSAFQKTMYGTHPYANVGFGDAQSVRDLTVADFKNYTGRYLARENIVISVVGDITPDALSSLLDKTLSGLPANYAPDVTLSPVQIPPEAAMQKVPHDMPQAMVAFGLEGLARNDPDYIPAYVANYILGGNGLNSRLADELRIRRGLTYSVRSQLSPKRYGAAWSGMYSTKKETLEESLSALREAVAGIINREVSDDELADAKAYLTGSFMLDLSSNGEVANFLTMMQIHQLGSDYMDKRNALIESVTHDDIRRVSRRLFDVSRLRIAVVGGAQP